MSPRHAVPLAHHPRTLNYVALDLVLDRRCLPHDQMVSRQNHPSPNAVHPPVTGYHHQVEVGSWRRWVVLSGQVGVQPDGQVSQDPIEQLVVALENVRQNLFAADLRVDDVVKLTFHLVGDVDKQRLHEVVAGWLAGHAPAMTMLFVAELAEPGYRVQVEVWAAH